MKTIKYLIIILLTFFSNIYGQADFGFTLKGGVNFPVGDFSNYYNTGFGGFGGVFYNINNTTRISFTIGYNNWPLDLDALNEAIKNSGNPTKFDIEAPIKAVPILINVKFFLRNNKSFQPYVVLEGGVYNIIREIYGRFIDENGNSHTYSPSTENFTDGSFNIGAGFEYPLNEIITFDISTRYHLVLNKEVYNFGDAGYGTSYSTNNFISVFAGINVFFE
ncbi:MAG: outer membrane beta-barrel protein [Bacteroidota bacterium]